MLQKYQYSSKLNRNLTGSAASMLTSMIQIHHILVLPPSIDVGDSTALEPQMIYYPRFQIASTVYSTYGFETHKHGMTQPIHTDPW